MILPNRTVANLLVVAFNGDQAITLIRSGPDQHCWITPSHLLRISASRASPSDKYQNNPNRNRRCTGNWRKWDLFMLIDLEMHWSHVYDILTGSISNTSVD
jgi:hypothetical protein